MWTPRISSIALSLSALALFSACSGQSGSNPSSSSFYIDSCTLGCTDGVEGDAVNCAIANTYQNQEISIIFSEPFDLFSVNSSSFRVTDVASVRFYFVPSLDSISRSKMYWTSKN